MSSRRPKKSAPQGPFAKLADLSVAPPRPTPPARPAGRFKDESLGHPPPADAPAVRAPGRGAVLDDDDRMALAMLVEGVTPLARKPMPIDALGGSSAEHRARLAKESELHFAGDEAARAQQRALTDPGSRFEVHEDGRRVEGRRLELPLARLGELRRGSYSVERTLDLHGKTLDAAREALTHFLEREVALGERAVLIVHGKGNHSPLGHGVLRLEVAAWLSQGAASAYVAAFCTALPDEGGDGAVRVLLRRPR